MGLKTDPLKGTIIFGLVAMVLFFPLGLSISIPVGWIRAWRAVFFFDLAIYSFCLCFWSGTKIRGVIFPLLLAGGQLIFVARDGSFFFTLLFVLSWIRSGLCFPMAWPKAVLAEALFSIGGGFLVAYFSPARPLSWSLAVWLFFLVQSLYFPLVRPTFKSEKKLETDPFEAAQRKAQCILNQ